MIGQDASGQPFTRVGDIISVTTPKLRQFTARIYRIDDWSYYPVKVEYRNKGGVLVREAVNLAECGWHPIATPVH